MNATHDNERAAERERSLRLSEHELERVTGGRSHTLPHVDGVAGQSGIPRLE